MLSVSLDCPYLNTLSVFSYVCYICIPSYILLTICTGVGIGDYFDLLTHSYIFLTPHILLQFPLRSKNVPRQRIEFCLHLPVFL
jgi:hypothetical protein